jgi:AcrR family transcriptional regulator
MTKPPRKPLAASGKRRSAREEGVEPTRERLLRATERLVAMMGVDGVSTRQISTEAETELGSIHHYFGTKDQLVQAVLDWRVDLIDRRMQALIEAARAARPRLTTRDLAEFLVLPFEQVTVDTDRGTHNYAGYLIAVSNYPPLARRIAMDTPWALRLLDLYAEIRPDFDPAERRRRIAFATFLAVGAIAERPIQGWLANTMPKATEGIVESLLDCVTAMLETARSPLR